MSLGSTKKAILTARMGAARMGAVRMGFTPKDTKGLTPGSVGPFYFYGSTQPTAVSWTPGTR